MMYGNGNYNPTASAAKAIVVFLMVILASAGILFIVASGNVGPEANARAEQIKMKTRLDEAGGVLALKFQEAEYQQKLDQDARAFAQWLTIIDWGARALFAGLALAAIILAAGKSAQWIRQVQTQAPPKQVEQPATSPRQVEQPAPAQTVPIQVYTLEQMNHRMEGLAQQVENTQSQLIATQERLDQLQVRAMIRGRAATPFSSRASERRNPEL